jgi:uncharacterized membrane protein YgcG
MPAEDFKPDKGGKGNKLLSPATLTKLLDAAARPEVVMDAAQFVGEKKAGKIHYRLRRLPPPEARGPGAIPHFLLSRGVLGPRIFRGLLEWSVTTMTFERIEEKNYLVSQDPIPGIETTLPAPWADSESTSEELDDWRDLDWWGDIYLQWLVDPETCEVLEASIVGPDKPDLSPLSLLTEELTRSDSSGSALASGYYLKIGTVPEEGDIVQERTGIVSWAVTFIPEAPGSSSSSASSSSESSSASSSSGSSAASSSGSDSGGSSAPSSGASSGSEKSSNAIVPAPWLPEGFCALATVESNQVLFDFLLSDVPLTGRRTVFPIDPRWIELCEPGTLRVAAAPNGDRPFPVCATVRGSSLHLTAWPLLRPGAVTLRLTGIRRGFRHWNLPARTREQFESNERSLASMYPR